MNRKLSLSLLTFFSLIILVLGFLSIKRQIKAPFTFFEKEEQEEKEGDIAILQKIDSDNDGLSDFEEIYVYKTSPYLPDTDGDGYTDKEEIEKGYDPLCPAGKTCPSPTEKKEVEKEDQTTTTPAQEMTIEEIREALIKAGLPKEIIDQIDDKTLRELYNETVKETGIKPEELLSNVSLEKFGEELSGEEIRKLLISYGMKEEDLKNISDEDLKKLFQEAIKQ